MKQSQKCKDAKALAVLDMDGTLLESRSVDVLCQKFGLETKLREIDTKANFIEDYKVSEAIAQLFAKMRASELQKTFDGIGVVNGAKNFINFLKERGFLTAIVTDSYVFLATRLAKKLRVDAVRGNELEIVDGLVTGRLIMPLGWEKTENCQKKAVCKLHAMYELAQKNQIGMDKTLVVGDSKSDSCIIERAAIGVAFKPKDLSIVKIADLVVYGDFFELMDKLKSFLGCVQ